MTHEEWKKLVKEYRETDSIKRRDELKRKACDVSCGLCQTLEKLHNKWGADFVDDSGYIIGRGHYSLKDFDENTARIVYTDHWSHGGYCDIGISVPMEYLDFEKRKRKNAELRKNHIHNLNREFEDNTKYIEGLKKRCEEIRVKLLALEEEQESDPYCETED